MQVGEFRDPCSFGGTSVGMRDVADKFSGNYNLLSGEEVSSKASSNPDTAPAPDPDVVARMHRVLSMEGGGAPLAAPTLAAVQSTLQQYNGDVFACLSQLLAQQNAVSTAVTCGSDDGDSPAAAVSSNLIEAWSAGGGGTGVRGSSASTVASATPLPTPVAHAASTLYLLKANEILVDPSPVQRPASSPTSGGGIGRESNSVALPPEATTCLTIAMWVKVESYPQCTNAAGDVVAPFQVRSRVWGNYRATGSWYAGRITVVNPDGTFNIVYDDGDSEINVAEECVSDRKVRSWWCAVAVMRLGCGGLSSSR